MWNQLSDEQKRHVNLLCHQRYKRAMRKRKQQQGDINTPDAGQGELDL